MMKNVFRLLLAAALCALLPSWVQASEPPEPPPPPPAAATLLNATGAEYLAERDAALALPQADFEPILAYLLRPEASPKENVIGWALQVRRDRPAAAEAFDADSAHVLANPNRQMRHGRPDYLSRLPESPDDDPLIFEWLLKRSDVPQRARWRFDMRMGRQFRISPLTPVAALALLDEPTARPVELISAALRRSGETLDPRVLNAALAEYHRYRAMSVKPNVAASTLVSLLSQRSDPAIMAAIQTLMDEERTRAQAAGVEPWNDASARQNHMDAMAARTQAKRTAHSTAVALTPEELAALEAQVEHALFKLEFRLHWEALERAAARVGIAGGQG